MPTSDKWRTAPPDPRTTGRRVAQQARRHQPERWGSKIGVGSAYNLHSSRHALEQHNETRAPCTRTASKFVPSNMDLWSRSARFCRAGLMEPALLSYPLYCHHHQQQYSKGGANDDLHRFCIAVAEATWRSCLMAALSRKLLQNPSASCTFSNCFFFSTKESCAKKMD